MRSSIKRILVRIATLGCLQLMCVELLIRRWLKND